ncbi:MULTISPECIES: hypothetical protein [Glutamicibacter]|uniref:Nucleotidyltransferase family protein n=1 Tax=Glutamicibacter halophytocola TaxID=1933880 RepID=A0A5B8IQ35_9MICC|nr:MULTISPECIES: hypothetical protein [Glutamicibacter]MBF6670588.1 hypothetical protein [Glutamicibacter sp. FBE19]QDY66508.1 hypothetical protein FQA45_09310 [Glutamicibacter halophytocola]UUX58618.1 hypothetical protein NUH22_15155 [Glutamicibacter halophytocola]
MSPYGGDSPGLLVRARAGLLDALQALEGQRDALVVIGAQAVYLRTGELDVALAPATNDSDFSLDPRLLQDDPRIEQAMRRAGFLPSAQPGSWLREDGIPVDLMVPRKLAGSGRRSVSIPPHDKFSARQTRGIEATLVDFDVQEITSLDLADNRSISAKVAGPAALLVAKIHKIVERLQTPMRSNDKDAHDSYRILRSVETSELRNRFLSLLNDELSQQSTMEALVYLREHFAAGPESAGSMMAGRAEAGLGDPSQVSLSVAFLAEDLINALVDGGIAIRRQ